MPKYAPTKMSTAVKKRYFELLRANPSLPERAIRSPSGGQGGDRRPGAFLRCDSDLFTFRARDRLTG
jgi:hypothetical protein